MINVIFLKINTYNVEFNVQPHLRAPFEFIHRKLGENCSLLSFVIHKVSELHHSVVSGSVANHKFTEIYLEKGKYQQVLHWLLYFLIRQIDGR